MSGKSTLLLGNRLKELKMPSFPKPQSTEGCGHGDVGRAEGHRARTIASLCPSSPIPLLQRHTFGGFGLRRC